MYVGTAGIKHEVLAFYESSPGHRFDEVSAKHALCHYKEEKIKTTKAVLYGTAYNAEGHKHLANLSEVFNTCSAHVHCLVIPEMRLQKR